MFLPIVARSAVIASSSSLRKPAAAAFALPLGLRAATTVPRISPALRGGNGAIKTNGNILNSARQMRAQRMMNQMSMSSPADTSPAEKKTAAELEWPANKVRSRWMEFFKEKDHVFVKSSPVVPLDDPTLLFTNAGMNQFKPIFLGQVDPKSPMATYEKAGRAVNTQKCIRAGGKHNDLDDVGKDTYHHTFFEMLGTWSFGNYFKQEAIDWAWEILTEEFKLPKDRLYASYCEGNQHLGGTVPVDLETRDMWLKHLPADRVIPGSMDDNFWEMGDTGPCGPCTELHYDRIGGGRNAAHLVNMDDPDVLEVWNLVFIQFNREASGNLQTLPQQHVDTGMGFERLVSVLQDKRSNYDTDVFTPLFDAIQSTLNVPPYTGKIGKDDADLKDTAYRVLADHARTLSYAIADGAVPSNEGRGYVLRRVLRRAVRYGQQILNAPPGFFSKLIPTVVETYKDTFPELETKQDFIVEIVKEEEESFEKMLVGGIKYFNEVSTTMLKSEEKMVSGKDAFFLYDTMGFPVDLTQIMAEEKGLSVDVEGFQKEMSAQKARSRDAAKAKKSGGGVDLALGVQETADLQNAKIAVTDDNEKFVWDQALPATVQAIYTEKGFLEDGAVAQLDTSVGIVVDATTYYAESGGQVGDSGQISVVDEKGKEIALIDVYDTQVYAGFVLHKGAVVKGSVSVGCSVKMQVDYDRRSKIAPNHSLTHVLNYALRKVLGGEIDQKGSLCDEDKLRFDFTAKGALTSDQLTAVEVVCQEQIAAQLPVDAQVVSLEKAMAISSLRAVFGEQYPDPVRVLSVGNKVSEMVAKPEDAQWMTGSVELCGGTHLTNTKDAQAFALVQEEAVAKGIRRITAVTRDVAQQAIATGVALQARLKSAAAMPKNELGQILTALKQDIDAATMSYGLKGQLRVQHDALSKEYMVEKKQMAAQVANVAIAQVVKQIEALGDAKVAVFEVDVGGDSKMLKSVMAAAQKAAPAMAICLAASDEEKGSLMCNVPDAGKGALKANEWLNESLKVAGGKGGGKADSAQGQVPDAAQMSAVLAAAKAFADSKL